MEAGVFLLLMSILMNHTSSVYEASASSLVSPFVPKQDYHSRDLQRKQERMTAQEAKDLRLLEGVGGILSSTEKDLLENFGSYHKTNDLKKSQKADLYTVLGEKSIAQAA